MEEFNWIRGNDNDTTSKRARSSNTSLVSSISAFVSDRTKLGSIEAGTEDNLCSDVRKADNRKESECVDVELKPETRVFGKEADRERGERS